MFRKIFYILLISFSILACTVNVNAKELNEVSSINTLQIHHALADAECTGILGNPEDDTSTAWLVQEVMGYIRIIGVVLVLILSSFDFTRAIIQNDAKFMARIKGHLLTRGLAILLLFMLPTIVYALLTAFGIYSSCEIPNINVTTIIKPFIEMSVLIC